MCLLRIFMEQTLDCIYATMSCANLTDTGLWIGSRIHQWPITQFIWSVPSQFINYCSLHYINKIYTYHICAFYVNNKIKDDFSSPIWYILTIVFGWLDSEVKVIYTKYSKHLLYTVAQTIDCVCSRMNNSWLIHDFHSTFQAYVLPHTLTGICVSLFKFHTWILRHF